MTDWHTNLMKDYVPTPVQRRACYLGMVSFLALCGFGLVTIFYQATTRLVHTVHEQSEVRQVEAKFRELHGGLDGNMVQVAQRLEGELRQAHAQLKAASALVDRRINLSKILAGLRQPLPYDTRLVRVNLNPSRGIAQFDLVMPDTPDRELSQAGQLVDAWNNHPLLQQELRDIRIMGRQTQRFRDDSVVVLRLEGKLPGGKG